MDEVHFSIISPEYWFDFFESNVTLGEREYRRQVMGKIIDGHLEIKLHYFNLQSKIHEETISLFPFTIQETIDEASSIFDDVQVYQNNEKELWDGKSQIAHVVARLKK